MDAVALAGSAPTTNRNVPIPAVLGGRYELELLIGHGGNGQVYRALDHSLRRHVAVKMLYDTEASAARFEREINLQTGLKHSSLIPLLDAGAHGGRRYLVMPLIQGTTLADRIASAPLTGRETRRIGAALAGALDYVHAHGIVHHDVKPSNVLLGRGRQVFLADFGIACRRGEPEPTATAHFPLTGTAAYLAPEQVEHGMIGCAGDVYALGLVLLEALTGVHAYRGTALEQALARLWRQPQIPASLGPQWSGLLTAMTARDPARRPTPRHITKTLHDVGSPSSSVPSHHWAHPLQRHCTAPLTRPTRSSSNAPHLS
jgi:eukaryotic-like serine/threonine-protein kinase